MIDMRLGDCMDLMASLPDGAFDLAIVDPPYGIGAPNQTMGTSKHRSHGKPSAAQRSKNRLSSGAGKLKGIALQNMSTEWDSSIPTEEYWDELFRVSKNQIIWGGNYFPLGPTRCVICWNKLQAWESFSQWEMAWTSFDSPASMFSQDNNFSEPGKIHPTQKPVALYKWLLTKYAKPGQTVLDTHGGSGSDCIACHDLGFDLTWIEKDPDYYASAVARYQTHASQLHLFDPKTMDDPTPLNLDL
jgi:site-specific DNA-methyltransferase (adenine-specific)